MLFNKVWDGRAGEAANADGAPADRREGVGDSNEEVPDPGGRAADGVIQKAVRYFEGPMLARVPESAAVRSARIVGEPLLAHAPDAPASRAYWKAAAALGVRPGNECDVADRFESAVMRDPP